MRVVLNKMNRVWEFFGLGPGLGHSSQRGRPGESLRVVLNKINRV